MKVKAHKAILMRYNQEDERKNGHTQAPVPSITVSVRGRTDLAFSVDFESKPLVVECCSAVDKESWLQAFNMAFKASIDVANYMHTDSGSEKKDAVK